MVGSSENDNGPSEVEERMYNYSKEMSLQLFSIQCNSVNVKNL